MAGSGKDPSQLLEDAAELIRTNGWHQGDMWPWTGRSGGVYLPGMPTCAIGAVRVADGARQMSGGESLAGWRALVALADHIGTGQVHNIIDWNDQASRTADEVIDGLLHAAKTLRNDGV